MKGLRYKIAFGYMVVVLTGSATSVFAVYNFSVVNQSVASILEEEFQITLAAQNMVKHLERQENAQLSMILDDPDLAYIQFSTNRVGFLGWHEKAREYATTGVDSALLNVIETKYREYIKYADSLYGLLQRPGGKAVAPTYKFGVVRPLAESLKEDCFQVLERSQDAISRTQAKIETATRGAMVTVIVASVVSIILSFGASIRSTRSLHPLEVLRNSVRRIGSGNLGEKIDVYSSDDEIGELSMEFNKMTERLRRYEEMNIHQLIAEKKKSETIVASIADPMIVADEHQQILLMNGAAEELFGVPPGSWNGKSLNAVVQDGRWMDLLLGRKTERDDALLTIEKGGKVMYYRPRQAMITDEQGGTQGTVTQLQDVTRFKDLDRMKSEFVATVSHELRTPLTSLNMSVDILLQEVLGALTSRQQELIAAAKDDVERLRKLVHDLLELSRLESGRQEIVKEQVRMCDLVDEALKPLQLQFREKGIALKVSVPDDLAAVPVDRRQFTWVISNLANNALRFTDPGGTVTITATSDVGGMRISVKDTGRGIALGDLESIFEKFVQVQNGEGTTPGSVGLGLAIARSVVEAHGGTIWVESKLNEGSTFTFTVPRGTT